MVILFAQIETIYEWSEKWNGGSASAFNKLAIYDGI